MAAIDLKTLATQFRGFSRLPALRQFGLMAGLAASVAIGMAIVLWSQSPSYSLLYGGLSDKDRAAVISALGKAGIDYHLDASSGAVLVPQSEVYKARIRLAAQGLPHEQDSGYDLLSKNQGFGTSQFVEQARYNHMLEEELARSIMSIDAVDKARVHLALPKQSVFVESEKKPTAAVVLELYAGRRLDPGQVAGIVHLVSSSVPGLQSDEVTVVDQSGRLLTRHDQPAQFGLTARQFTLTQQLEKAYQQRVEDILAPIVGSNGVRAQVVADVDYTQVDKTSENYDGAKPALRSEQTSEDIKRGGDQGQVPGSLTNQPPQGGVAQPAASQSSAGKAGAAQSGTSRAQQSQQQNQSKPVETRRRATRNYELGHTISHIKETPGQIRRLSVAVVINDKTVSAGKGKVKHVPYSAAEMTRITGLVKEAVGYDKARGDTVNVINTAFRQAPPPPQVAGPPIWQQPYFQTIVKELLGALGVALLLFGVLRPAMKGLAQKGGTQLATTAGSLPADGTAEAYDETERPLRGGATPELTPSLAGSRESDRPKSIQYAEHLAAAKSMAKEDPKRMAQVVKSWLAADEHAG